MDLVVTIIVLLVLAVLSVHSAYRNGVNDGYGYSQEPNNPGYRKAGEYLRKYCKHRWSQLNANCADVIEIDENGNIHPESGKAFLSEIAKLRKS